MRRHYEIDMMRDERGVWVAPWERGQARTAAADQAAPPSAEPAIRSVQEKPSWREFLYSLLPRWRDAGAYCDQRTA